MHDFSIQDRWVYKDAVSGFFSLTLTLFFCGLLIKIIAPNTDYPDPFWLLLTSVFLIIGLLYSIASYRISKVRKNNFTFSLLKDSISFKQAVLLEDTRNRLFWVNIVNLLIDSIRMVSDGTKILRQNEFSINYTDIESFNVKRGLWDRLFGLYRIVFTFKNNNYSEFNSPRIYNIVGISSPEGTFNALQYKWANIAVVPGLSTENLNEIRQILQQKILGDNKSSVPKQATPLGIIGAILCGIIGFFLLMVVITALLS